ncbi:NAD-dependent succinate-semialdehyde dehydrogenase [Nocardioides sp. AN3]
MTQYHVTNPATGQLLRTYPTQTDEQVDAAIAAAQHAFLSWSRASGVTDRAMLIGRVAKMHTERRIALATAMNEEMGKPIHEALAEVDFSASIYAYYAENAETFLADEPINLREGEGSALIRRQPVGVLLGIMPWNYPVYQVARFAGPNLALGNTVLLKHAPQCPQSAALLQEVFLEAGYPEGAYTNLYVSNGQVAQIIGDSRVQGISLTGSERAGSAVAQMAGRHLKKVVLELGGSDPFLVLNVDDLDATVEAALAARMENMGQACNAAKRIIVQEDRYDDFVATFTRSVLAISPAPLSSLAAAERLEEQVAQAVAEGATLVSAGQRDGAHYPPGVLTGVCRSNSAYRAELFGPVAMIFKVRDEAEAIEVANDPPYGLGSYVFTTDPDQAARVADRIEAGMVFINGVGAEGVELPFGGIKRSGFGRELGRLGIDEFVNKKVIRTLA